MSQEPQHPSPSEQETVAIGEWKGLLLAAMTPDPDIPDDALFAADPSDYANQPGQTIGPYTLREKIGEGGFGLVWRAEQISPIRRQVALKVIKIGMDTLQVVARFNVERQTLALMDHPGIASVFDAGTTTTGRPYFVMELVHGLPITTYCTQHALTLPERLRLFVDVCKAVQHAHQKGILHRDLKPPNILVIDIDGTPQPKIIDFGIAKALESSSLPASNLATRGDILLGTPDYMSPEQAIPGNPDLDTRTDIYSLGVVLHEMLTGQTPQKISRGKTATLLGRIQQFPLSDLSLPSSIAIESQESSPFTLFAPKLKGDLDWIILKVLAHNRSDRYDSADALASDLLNHLANRPISAGKPSLVTTTTKFIRRNRFVVLSAATLFLILTLATTLTTTAFIRESKMRRQADDLRLLSDTQSQKAQQTLDFLTRLLERTAQHVKTGKNPEALRLALEELQTDAAHFSSDPDVNQAIAGRTGIIFRALRDDAKAHPLIEQQVQLLESSRPPDDPELLAARELYARTLYLQGNHQKSHQQYDQLVHFWQSQLHTKEGPRRLFLVRRIRADVWAKTGRLKEALAECSDIRSTASPEIRQHPSWPIFIRTHAEALVSSKRFDEAQQAYDDILESIPVETPEQKHDAATIYQSRSSLLVKKRDFPSAINSLQKAIELERQAKGDDSPWITDWLVSISRLLTAQDRNTEAISATKSALATALCTAQSNRLHLVHRALADNYEAAGQHEHAAASFKTAAELEMQMNPVPNDAWLDRSRYVLHTALCGRFDEATAVAHTLRETRSTWAANPEMKFDLSRLDTALAFANTAFTEFLSAKRPHAITTKLRQLGTPIITQFLLQHHKKNSPYLTPELLASMERATQPKNQTSPPSSADILALDQALTDRWLSTDDQGDLLELAAALRVTGQPHAAITLYQTIANLDPSTSPILNRRHTALILASETWLQLGDKTSANAILTSLNERHHSRQEPITNPVLLNRMTDLLTSGDTRPFKPAPLQKPSPPPHQPPKDTSPKASPSALPKPSESAPNP